MRAAVWACIAALGASALGGSALSGCATSTRQKTMEQLREAVEGYNHAFRWKNYERAAQYRPNDVRSAFLAAYQDDEASLQVEEFQVRQVDILTDKAATVAVHLTYLMLPSVTVKQSTLVQHWAEVNGAWVLESEDNAIRNLDPSKQPRDPRARTPDPEPTDDMGKTEVEVVKPGAAPSDEDDEDEPR